MSTFEAAIPRAPPLPAPKAFQRARDAANRILGYASRPPSPRNEETVATHSTGRRGSGRLASLGASQNATASHKTGLEIKTLSINENGTHALVGGKDIFKTIRVEHGVCVEDVNLRAAIRSTPTHASGKPRQLYNIDIADVAWAKGDTGEYVAAATESGKIIIYDVGHAGLPAAQLHEHYRQVHRITFNPHKGSLLLSGSQDGTVRLWDVRDARQHVGATQTRGNLQSKSKFADTSDSVRDVKWSPTDGMDFAFATDGGYAQVWDMRNFNRPKMKIIAHHSTCMSVDWHPDGKHLASAGLDHLIKVWDVSVKPGKKPGWEVKTPYPLSNARWRPACEVPSFEDEYSRQCTQLAAAYDRQHPVLHIWDLRRPALPFRELSPHAEAPTDLLWHSQDLLWTVGRDGTFLQVDMQHSSRKVMDQHSVNAFDVSATGEIASFNMHRSTKRTSKQRRASVTHTPEAIYVSRSWADDSIDNSFLRAYPQVRRPSVQRSHRQSSSSVTPMSPLDTARLLSLDQVFGHRSAIKPQQVAWRGQLPEPYVLDPLRVEYMAQQSSPGLAAGAEGYNETESLQALFVRNSNVARDVGLHRLATRWDIVGFAAIEHLRRRGEMIKASPDKTGTMNSHTDSFAPGDLTEMAANHLGMVQDGSSVIAKPIANGKAITAGSGEPEISNVEPPQSDSHCAFAGPPPGLASHAHKDAETSAPFELSSMLRDLLLTYTQMLPNAQTAAHLILALGPCLPVTRPLSRRAAIAAIETYVPAHAHAGSGPGDIPHLIEQSLSHIVNAGLQPLQLEAILSTYHEQLLAQRCFVQAAALRRVCYPAFPAVYEQGLRDNSVALLCGSCGSPVSTGSANRCGTCKTKPFPCPICCCDQSPFVDSAVGARLWSHCLLCNHGGHAACLRTSILEKDVVGCATIGCLCNCAGTSGIDKKVSSVV